jgi:hypothetical protein
VKNRLPFRHSQVASRSLIPTDPAQRESRDRGNRPDRMSIPVSPPRAAVAQLPVNNRPETGTPRHSSFSTSTGWFFALSCPGRSAARAKRSGALQTRDRSSPWRSRISDAPLAAARAASHPRHADLGRIRHPYLLVKQPTSFPRRISAPGFLHLCFAKPRSRGGGAPRDVRAQRRPLGLQMTPQARRLARRLASHSASRRA